MPRLGASPFSFPDFRGATRLLVLTNLAAFFALLLAELVYPKTSDGLIGFLSFQPDLFLHGAFWQPFTYSLIHLSLFGTLFELLSLWFLAGFLENLHTSSWITGLFVASVLGTAAAAIVIYAVSGTLGLTLVEIPLYGCFGGIFGLCQFGNQIPNIIVCLRVNLFLKFSGFLFQLRQLLLRGC